ncbi:MAG: histidinol-phosphate transaminase [Alphaproteobacteria bacterium]
MTEPHPTIRPQPGILDIALYVSGDAKIDGSSRNQVTKLSSNENPYGSSSKATEAFKAASAALAIYPSTDHGDLRAAIGQVHGVDPERVICGAGSDEIIAFLCQVYAGVGDEVLYTEHGFSMYKISALAAGATPVVAPEDNRRTDVDALLAACTDKTKLVFIANPNNPTGTMISAEEVARLAEGLPEQAILVLDGAYAEFVEGDFDAGLAMIEARDNVVMTRTFSKIYGLGGLRIGWGYGPAHIIDALNRVRGPFNLSGAAMVTAEAAVLDVDYTAECAALNATWRDWLTEKLTALGLNIDESHGNFILVRFATPELAEGCDAALRLRGLIVRKVGGYGFPEGLRITIGDEIACRRVVQAVKDFLEGQT